MINFDLTIAEKRVYELLLQGLRAKEISEKLVVSKATAKNHIHNILSKKGLFSTNQLLAKEIEKLKNKGLKEFLKCPYCGFEADISSFPDYFYDDKDQDIIELLKIYNINIVTCGMCGKAIVQKKDIFPKIPFEEIDEIPF